MDIEAAVAKPGELDRHRIHYRIEIRPTEIPFNQSHVVDVVRSQDWLAGTAEREHEIGRASCRERVYENV
jgi:hypothetical protein